MSNIGLIQQLDGAISNWKIFRPHAFNIGADVEYFIQTPEGTPISSQAFFGEDERIQQEEGIVERDGFPIEIQPKASTSPYEVTARMRKLSQEFKKRIHTNRISTAPLVMIDLEDLQRKDDKKSLVFGCKPDYDAWKDGEENIKKDAKQTAMRTAGGHFHIDLTSLGYTSKIMLKTDTGNIYKFGDEYSKNLGKNVIMWADLLLGTLSVLLDNPSKRNELYGTPGSMRWCSYGVEYRTLSNYWAMSSVSTRVHLYIWQLVGTIATKINCQEFMNSISCSNDYLLETIKEHKRIQAYAIWLKVWKELFAKDKDVSFINITDFDKVYDFEYTLYY